MNTLTIAVAVQVLVDLALIFALIWCVRQLKGYRHMVRVMTAESKTVPTSRELIMQWVAEYENPETSHNRKQAYKKRLIEVGYMNEDGTVVGEV